MSGINLATLMEAHGALMEAWNMDYTRPPSFEVRRRCMAAAAALKVELVDLVPQIEVRADAPAEKVAA